MDRGSGRRVSRGMLPLLAFHAINEYYRLERKPPVTAGLLVANTLVYLRPGFLDHVLPALDEVWFNPHLVLKVAVYIASNPVFHERTKHIEVDCYFVRDAVMKKLVVTPLVSSSNQLADILTKPLFGPAYRLNCYKLGLGDLYIPA